MNSIVKIGLIGAGAFVAYELFFKGHLPPILSSVPPSATSSATQQPQNTPSPASVSVAAAATTKDLIVRAAQSGAPAGWDHLYTWDQWNYFYAQVRGVPGPDLSNAWPGRDRGYRMAIDEYWAAMTAQGLSGLGSYAIGRWKNGAAPYLVS